MEKRMSGPALKATIRQLGLRQPDLAEALGVRQDTLRKWVSGADPIPYKVPDDLASIARGAAARILAEADRLEAGEWEEPEADPYFLARARAVLKSAQGDPDKAVPLAQWAQKAFEAGNERVCAIVAEDGTIVGEAAYTPRINAADIGGTYVTKETSKKYDLRGTEIGLATSGIEKAIGQKVIVVKYWQVCQGQA